MTERGYSAIELMVTVVVLGLLSAIAIPTFSGIKLAMDFSSGERALEELLVRARWSAIQSGRAETRVLIEGNFLRVRAGTASNSPIVTWIKASDYNATIQGTNLPLRLDSRGFRMNATDAIPTVTLVNSRISASTTFRVELLGRVTSS